jgi:hypothetical protein
MQGFVSASPSTSGKVTQCELVDLTKSDPSNVFYVTGTTATTYNPKDSPREGWSIACETTGTVDYVKYFLLDDVKTQFSKPFWIDGDNSGKKINKLDYLSECGSKTIVVKFYTWQGGDNAPIDSTTIKLNADCGATPTKAPVKLPTMAPVKPPTMAPVQPPVNVVFVPTAPVCTVGQDCWYDQQCAFNTHYKTCLGKKYTRAQCYGHYKHQCDGRTYYSRHLKEVEGGSRVLAGDHAECMAGDYNMFLVMKGAHMSGLATPVEENLACPNVVFHSSVEIEGAMTKSILTIEQDGVADISEDEKLHLGTESLASIVAAFEGADVSKKGEKAYDAVTNNCVVLLRNMADPLNIPVDKRMIGFVSKRLLAESADHMVDMMKKSPAFSSIVGSGGRFLKGIGAEEIVSKVIQIYV